MPYLPPQFQPLIYTVKHGYSELAYNESMLTVKWISFPLVLKHDMSLLDVKNYVDNESENCSSPNM